MRLIQLPLVVSLFLGLSAVAAPVLAAPVVGVGLVNEPYKETAAEQETTFRALQSAGVRVIRAGIPNTDQGLAFAERAFAHGIKIEWLTGISPVVGTPWPKPPPGFKGKIAPRGWPLSSADTQAFKSTIGPQLALLEAKGIVLAGIELGNEINWTGFNADFPFEAQGRILSEKDLADDPEGRQIARGYLKYLETLAALKEIRDGSKLNKHTPIISAGLADLDNSAAWLRSVKADSVDVVATLHFLQVHGLDRLVDGYGYGLHLYPLAVAPGTPQGLASLRTQVNNNGLPECQPPGSATGKPCWITEWDFNGLKGLDACPADDAMRLAMVREMRIVLGELAKQQRLGGAVFYTWQGQIHAPKEDHDSVFLCGAVTPSGRLAMAPL